MNKKRILVIVLAVLLLSAVGITVYAAIHSAEVPGTQQSPNNNSNPDDARKYITTSNNGLGGKEYAWDTGEEGPSVANPEQTINGYDYKYGKYYNGSAWVSMSATDPMFGWGCRVSSPTATTYAAPLGMLDGYPVTRFDNCYRGCTALTTAPAIPHTALSTDNAFYGCTALTTAELNGTTILGKNMFTGCSSLAKVYVGASVKTCAATSAATSPFYNVKSGCKVFAEYASAPAGFGAYYAGASTFACSTSAYEQYFLA